VDSNYVCEAKTPPKRARKRLPAHQQNRRERSKMRFQGFLGLGIPTVTINAVHDAVVEVLDSDIPHLDPLLGIPETDTRDRFGSETKPWLHLVGRGESRGRSQKSQASGIPLLIARVVFLRTVSEMAPKRLRKDPEKSPNSHRQAC